MPINNKKIPDNVYYNFLCYGQRITIITIIWFDQNNILRTLYLRHLIYYISIVFLLLSLFFSLSYNKSMSHLNKYRVIVFEKL